MLCFKLCLLLRVYLIAQGFLTFKKIWHFHQISYFKLKPTESLSLGLNGKV